MPRPPLRRPVIRASSRILAPCRRKTVNSIRPSALVPPIWRNHSVRWVSLILPTRVSFSLPLTPPRDRPPPMPAAGCATGGSCRATGRRRPHACSVPATPNGGLGDTGPPHDVGRAVASRGQQHDAGTPDMLLRAVAVGNDGKQTLDRPR